MSTRPEGRGAARREGKGGGERVERERERGRGRVVNGGSEESKGVRVSGCLGCHGLSSLRVFGIWVFGFRVWIEPHHRR